MIYVVVEVYYDHYRFQKNLFASTDRDEALRFADQYSSDKEEIKFISQSDTLEADEKLCNDGSKPHHLWIQAL